MALTENKVEKKPQEGEKKSREVERKCHDVHRGADKKEKPLTKVIIRRLPPNIDQATFLNHISPVPDYDYIYTVKGDASLGENSFSRVYINFTKPGDIYDFKEKFDNYVFIDGKGHEYPAVVEYAAFQKIPKKRNKNRVDPKNGTIESDPIYLEFLESLNKPQETEVKAEYSYQIATETNAKQEGTTPLLEYIKNKRAEKLRIREERREERKRKELERRKIRDDERRRRFEEKSPIKSVVIKSQSSKMSSKETKSEDAGKFDKESPPVEPSSQKTYEKYPYHKSKEKKFDDRRRDGRKFGMKKEYPDRREYKSRRDDYRDRDYRDKDYRSEKDYKSKYDERRESESKASVKKVKKYSEKREERKVEAQKAEQKKIEENSAQETFRITEATCSKGEDKPREPKEQKSPEDSLQSSNQNISETSNNDYKNKEKDTETMSQKRIRNKDRPTLAIYRPGMLSKRRQTEGESENKEVKKE